MSFTQSRRFSEQDRRRPDLTLIIPCFNEAQRLNRTLEELRATLDAWPLTWEGIIVDDGSTDDTPAIARRAGQPFRVIHLERNLGKGGAIRSGVLVARGDVVAFTDADLPFATDSLLRAVELVRRKKYDAVFGDRHHPMSRVMTRRPFGRHTASRVFRMLQQWILPLESKDTQCALKVFHRDLCVNLFESLRSWGFAFDVEIVARAERAGARLGTVPVQLVRDEMSKVRLFRHSLPMLAEVVMTRIRLMKTPQLPPMVAPQMLKKSA